MSAPGKQHIHPPIPVLSFANVVSGANSTSHNQQINPQDQDILSDSKLEKLTTLSLHDSEEKINTNEVQQTTDIESWPPLNEVSVRANFKDNDELDMQSKNKKLLSPDSTVKTEEADLSSAINQEKDSPNGPKKISKQQWKKCDIPVGKSEIRIRKKSTLDNRFFRKEMNNDSYNETKSYNNSVRTNNDLSQPPRDKFGKNYSSSRYDQNTNGYYYYHPNGNRGWMKNRTNNRQYGPANRPRNDDLDVNGVASNKSPDAESSDKVSDGAVSTKSEKPVQKFGNSFDAHSYDRRQPQYSRNSRYSVSRNSGKFTGGKLPRHRSNERSCASESESWQRNKTNGRSFTYSYRKFERNHTKEIENGGNNPKDESKEQQNSKFGETVSQEGISGENRKYKDRWVSTNNRMNHNHNHNNFRRSPLPNWDQAEADGVEDGFDYYDVFTPTVAQVDLNVFTPTVAQVDLNVFTPTVAQVDPNFTLVDPLYMQQHIQNLMAFAALPSPVLLTQPHQLPINHQYPVALIDEEAKLKECIRDQIEYYFSLDNLQKDIYLRNHMDSEGYLPISLIASFRRVNFLTNDANIIIDSLRNSEKIEFSPDLLKIRTCFEPTKWPLRKSNADAADN